jgi:hypothetical protein
MCHKHENNQDYQIFLTKMKARACLVSNPNHETRKTKTQQMQIKIQ